MSPNPKFNPKTMATTSDGAANRNSTSRHRPLPSNESATKQPSAWKHGEAQSEKPKEKYGRGNGVQAQDQSEYGYEICTGDKTTGNGKEE